MKKFIILLTLLISTALATQANPVKSNIEHKILCDNSGCSVQIYSTNTYSNEHVKYIMEIADSTYNVIDVEIFIAKGSELEVIKCDVPVQFINNKLSIRKKIELTKADLPYVVGTSLNYAKYLFMPIAFIETDINKTPIRLQMQNKEKN